MKKVYIYIYIYIYIYVQVGIALASSSLLFANQQYLFFEPCTLPDLGEEGQKHHYDS